MIILVFLIFLRLKRKRWTQTCQAGIAWKREVLWYQAINIITPTWQEHQAALSKQEEAGYLSDLPSRQIWHKVIFILGTIPESRSKHSRPPKMFNPVSTSHFRMHQAASNKLSPVFVGNVSGEQAIWLNTTHLTRTPGELQKTEMKWTRGINVSKIMQVV